MNATPNSQAGSVSISASRPMLSEGPFLRSAGPWKQNIRLWLLMLPQYLASIYLQGPEILLAGLAVLLGSLLGCLFFAPYRGRAILSLDWLTNGWLVAIFSAGTTSPWPLDSLMRGLICGLLTARSGHSRLLTIPGSVPMLSLGLSFLLSRLKWASPFFKSWPIGFQWLPVSWPEAFILAAALIIFNKGRIARSGYMWPLAAGLFGLLLYYFFDIFTRIPLDSPYALSLSGRLATMLPPAILIAPRISRSRLELIIYELTFLVLFFKFPAPQLHSVFLGLDITAFVMFLVMTPLPLIRGMAKRKHQVHLAEVEPSELRARLKCGHQGTAAQLTKWLGPASCRLASEHDDGHMLCPYACLAFGDCARVCPTGALTIEKGFITVDRQLCQGCGGCRKACPKGLIEMGYDQVKAFIPCASASSLKLNSDYCRFSCLGCARCAKACPAGAISRPGSRGAMAINQQICLDYGADCGRICVEVCPRQIIKPPIKTRHGSPDKR